MRSVTGAALVIIGVTAAASPAEPLSPRLIVLQQYLHAVRSHEPGDTDSALYAIASWSNQQIRTLWLDVQTAMLFVHCVGCNNVAVRSLENGTAVIRYTKSDIIALHEMADAIRERHEDDELLKRAAILHADVVMLAQREGDPYVEQPPPSSHGLNPSLPSPQRIILKSVDGRQDRLIDAAVHWVIAYVLLARIPNGEKPAPQNDPTVRLWYQATISYLQDTALHDPEHFERALRLFPTDPELLFQAGCLHESLASPRVQAVLRSATMPRGMSAPFNSDPAELETAARFFPRSLELDPSRQEPGCGSDESSALLDRHEAGRGELRQVTDDVDHVVLRYYAALFLGREEEALGRRDAAREAYERAAAMFPLAQSPLIALSHLARDAGERDRALASIQRVLDLPLSEVDRRDPFWVYHFVQGRHLDELLDQLYRPFRHKERSP